jgi:hypothetical protein
LSAAEEGQARIGPREMTEAMEVVDTIKEERGEQLFEAMDLDGDMVTRAAALRLEVANDGIREYEKQHGGPVEDAQSLGALWVDGLLIGLAIGRRLDG